jgi:hypothetical protein
VPDGFRDGIVDLGERGIVGCLTRWLNLSSGLHPMDPKWRSHIGRPLTRGVIYQPHSLGSIRSSFEEQTTVNFDEFSAKNMENLLSKRTFNLVTPRSGGLVWEMIERGYTYRWRLMNEEDFPRLIIFFGHLFFMMGWE